MKINFAGVGFKHDKTFYINRPHGSGDYLLLFVRTRTIFELEEDLVTVEPNSVILFDKGTKQHYYTCEEHLMNDFVHFDIEDGLRHSMFAGIALNRPVAVSEPEIFGSLICFIVNEHHVGTLHREATALLLLEALLSKLRDLFYNFSNCMCSSVNIEMLIRLRTEIYSNPHSEWNLPIMAEKCHYSVSYFQTVYRKLFGVTCIHDVINARYLQAARLLRNTEYKIFEIAQICGYKNEVHFMRQFKSKAGITPKQYRLVCRNKPHADLTQTNNIKYSSDSEFTTNCYFAL